jgi:transaldolase
MQTSLDQLRALSVIVADTGDLDAIRTLKPVDATTNPSLVLKAAELPRHRGLVDDAIDWAVSTRSDPRQLLRLAAERLAVLIGREAVRLVPGRVSTEIDARLSFSTEASVSAAERLIAAYEDLGVDRSRILVKIAATWEGIQAARRLQQRGVDCNLTLVFNDCQADAAADAGAFLISPFVGRVTDWHRAKAGSGETLVDDPGVAFVRGVHRRFKQQDRRTIVMAASFRTIEQVLALAGCDRLTVSPDLLAQLDADSRQVGAMGEETPASQQSLDPVAESEFRLRLNADAMASEKLAEGIRGFIADTERLEALMGAIVAKRTSARLSA